MKPITILLLILFCSLAMAQRETTLTFEPDTNIQKKIVVDSLLKVYSPCEILVITKVTERKIYVETLAGHEFPAIKNDTLTAYSIGNYLTCKY